MHVLEQFCLHVLLILRIHLTSFTCFKNLWFLWNVRAVTIVSDCLCLLISITFAGKTVPVLGILYATCTLNTTVMRFSYDAPCSVAGRLKLWNVCVRCSHLQRVGNNVMSCWYTVCSPRRRRLLWLVQVSETLVLHTETNTYESQTTIYNTLKYFKTFDSIQLRTVFSNLENFHRTSELLSNFFWVDICSFLW